MLVKNYLIFFLFFRHKDHTSNQHIVELKLYVIYYLQFKPLWQDYGLNLVRSGYELSAKDAAEGFYHNILSNKLERFPNMGLVYDQLRECHRKMQPCLDRQFQKVIDKSYKP